MIFRAPANSRSATVMRRIVLTASAAVHGRFASESSRDCRRPARQLSAAKRSLFDYLIGSSEQRLRDCEAQRFCSLKVDDQFEFGRLLNWQFTWLLSLQYPSCISASLAEDFIAIASVAYEATCCDIL
jgi:hypothetical protein